MTSKLFRTGVATLIFAVLLVVTTATEASARVAFDGGGGVGRVSAVCDQLRSDITKTAKPKLFQTLFSSSSCDPAVATVASFDSACLGFVTLQAYVGSDANQKNAAVTLTGLSPRNAQKLYKDMDVAYENLDCASANTLPPSSELASTTDNIERVINGLEYWALMFCIVAIMVSAILWAVGSKGNNPGQELTGERGIIVAVTAALFIGGIPSIMNFATTNATQVHTVGVLTSGYPTNNTLGQQGADE